MARRPDDDPLCSALFTDLYELTMAQAYAAENMRAPAVFELFFRSMPHARNYLVAAGLEDVLDLLEGFHFTASDINYLRGQEIFSERFLEELQGLRFTGDVYALPEGTPVFANEPLVQVVAPLIEAQLVETAILNQVHFQTIAATKAARVVAAAAGRTVVDFGSRRAHGTDAALKVARSSYLAGIDGTSNVLAGKRYGIPIYGTMAHSYVQAHGREEDAFASFARHFPESTLLVDTYDTLAGVQKIIQLAHRLGSEFRVRAIRLDSGDLADLARRSRGLLDAAGLDHVRIFASSDLDEHRIQTLLRDHAPIDGFGVGTKLAVSPDAPVLDMAYKLVHYADQPRMKLSSRKVLYPGQKQVVRVLQAERMVRDIVGLPHEQLGGQPLLQRVMRQGRRLPHASPPLMQIQVFTRRQTSQLPQRLRQLERPDTAYEVAVSSGLERLRRQVRDSLSRTC